MRDRADTLRRSHPHGAAARRRLDRQHRPRADTPFVFRLVALVLEFSLSGPEQLGAAFQMLRERLGNPYEVAARLVAAHGPRIREHLHEYRALPDVAALFKPPAKGSAAARLNEARARLRQVNSQRPEQQGARGRALRRVATSLARQYGLRVFDELNTHAAEPAIRGLLGLPPRRARHRPKASTVDDLMAWALAEVRDGLGIRSALLLRALGRQPARVWPDQSDTADTKWLRRHLQRGRALRRASVVARSPDVAIIAFFRHYLLTQSPEERLDALSPLLVDAVRIPDPAVHRAFRIKRARTLSAAQRDAARAFLAATVHDRLARARSSRRG